MKKEKLNETATGEQNGNTCNSGSTPGNDFFLRRDALEYALRLKSSFITDEDQVLEAAKKFEKYLLGK